MKDFLLADRGWRTNAQLSDPPKAKTREGRQDRAIAAKVVHRVFVKDDWDTAYPFEQYVPKGAQDVPPMRGWRLVPEVWAHVYYGASRLQLAHNGKESKYVSLFPIIFTPVTQGLGRNTFNKVNPRVPNNSPLPELESAQVCSGV